MTADQSKSPRLNTPNPANYSSPSVPISVYKQLAGELSIAKGEVAALKSENQQLRSNNQTLQGQVRQVIQAAEHLKQMVNRYDFGAESFQPAPPETQSPLARRPAESFELMPPAHPELPAQQMTQAPMPEPQYIPPQPVAVAPRPQKPQNSPQKSARRPKPTQVATVAPPDLASTGDVGGGVNGWIILISAIAIILTAFGAGYMIVLPLLNNNNSTTR